MKNSQFKWRKYLKESRPDINMDNFAVWCTKNRPKKQIFDTEQELLQDILLFDAREIKSQFNWRQYLKESRPDINIHGFAAWCAENRQRKSIFNTEQELLQTILLYDNRNNGHFGWRKYLKENRPDINICSFTCWCSKYRDKKSVFNTEQELLQDILLYDNRNRRIVSEFKYQQYLKENRPDINIHSFKTWCSRYRTQEQTFNTEQELLQAICLYDLNKKYMIRRTQYNGIYDIIERETGLRFNFYRLEDILGLI